MMKSPCFTCTRVRDPQNCESKVCKEWREWYIARWEAMRRRIHQQIAGAPTQERGVPLGGRHYEAPHKVRQFLQNDPCNSCYCPKDLCTTPCQLRLAWEKRKGAQQ